MSHGTAILEFVNLLSAGLLAGTDTVVRFAVHPALAVLDEPAHLRLRQALIRRLRWPVPALFLTTALSGIAATLLIGTAAGVALRCVAPAAVLTWIVVTLGGAVPINQAALEWRPEAPPADWRQSVSRWQRLDNVRLGAALVTFGCFLAAVLS